MEGVRVDIRCIYVIKHQKSVCVPKSISVRVVWGGATGAKAAYGITVTTLRHEYVSHILLVIKEITATMITTAH